MDAEASAIVAADAVDVAVEHREDEEDSATVVDEEEAEALGAVVDSAEVEAVVSREAAGVEGALVDVEGVNPDSLCCSLELFLLFFDFSRSCMAWLPAAFRGFVWMGFYCKISFGAMYRSTCKCKIPTYCCPGPANASVKTS